MGFKTVRKLSLLQIAALLALLSACGGGGGGGISAAQAQPQSYGASPTTFSPGQKDPGSSTGNFCPAN